MTDVRVIVESPYAGGFANVKYGRECVRDCLNRGESPFASHLLYTQKNLLNDAIPEERRRGIDAAIGWLEVADYVCVYMDLGVSEGMVKGIGRAARLGKPVHLRWLKGGKKESVVTWEGDSEGNPHARVKPSDDARVGDGEIMDL